jgi:phosphatidylglycerophosphatase A
MTRPSQRFQDLTILASASRPSLRFLFSHPAHFFALGLGSGLAPLAPGTFGTLAGWILFYPMSRVLSPLNWGIFLIIGFLFGIWACGRTGRDLGVPDHGAMVLDEMIAIWVVLVVTPDDWRWQAAAVVLFRFFDIVKPSPIRYFDRRYKGGFGVMWDDLFAAFYTLLLIAIVVRLGIADA